MDKCINCSLPSGTRCESNPSNCPYKKIEIRICCFNEIMNNVVDDRYMIANNILEIENSKENNIWYIHENEIHI